MPLCYMRKISQIIWGNFQHEIIIRHPFSCDAERPYDERGDRSVRDSVSDELRNSLLA
jgi:hypothetical protein